MWHEQPLWRHGWKVFLLPLVFLDEIPLWLRVLCVAGILISGVADLVVWARARRCARVVD